MKYDSARSGAGVLSKALPVLPKVPDEGVRSIVDDMETTGLAVLPNYIQREDLERVQAFIEAAVQEAGGEYVALNGKEAVHNTLLEALVEGTEFPELLHRVYELGTGKPAPDQSVYQVCRCLKGTTGNRQSLIFHFDSYVVTALLPVIIPTEGQKGHLVMMPNLRKVRSAYFINLIDKLLLDNKLSQYLLKVGFNRGFLKFARVEMIPGNLYLFWGYRTLHANERCDVENIRATSLYHFGDPHADSGLRRRMGRVKVA